MTGKLLFSIKEFNCFIANDNSIGQVVISGELKSLYLLAGKLKMQNIKNVLLPVSAPFHCPLMKEATKEMKTRINETRFLDPKIEIVYLRVLRQIHPHH